MPQIGPIFSSRPLDQTTSWIQITTLDQTRPDHVFRTGHLRRTASSGFLPQTTQPDQLPHTDHPARPASSHKHPASTGQDAIVRYVSQVTSILCGLGHGRLIYKALDELCKAYFSHTFGLKSQDFLFLLYLIVFRVASGAPWAGKGLPCRFFIVGFLCRYSVSDRSSPFQKQFRPRLGVCSSFRRFNFVVSPSYVIVLNAVSRLVAPNSANFSITLHLLVYALGK